MIKNLKLTNVGPAPTLEFYEMGERLNLVSGDNGLGKSFLLDTAWWALTRKWPAEINDNLTAGKRAVPRGEGAATIEFQFSGKVKDEKYSSAYDRKVQAWTGRPGRPSNPGLVLYAMADGSFALWDPARNYWQQSGNVDVQDRQPAYVFSPIEVWNGLPAGNGSMLCNGLIADWARWQDKNGESFKRLCRVLKALSSSPEDELVPGELTRLSIDDVRDIPSLRMPYGQDVAVLHASAGMKRIISLAYFLVWAWEEHLIATKQLGDAPTHQMVFLVDEIEAHLHPKWQRKIIPALIAAVDELSTEASVQIIAVTHSPLIMASVEPMFDAARDAWFDFDLQDGAVVLSRREFEKKGDILNWLTSEAFDMQSGRAEEYEQIIAKAETIIEMDERPANLEQVHNKLVNALSPGDDFLFRWRYICKSKGWLK